MTDIGVATRVHMREERALSKYRVARWTFLDGKRWFGDNERPQVRRYIRALYWRSRWSALREIIDAEERRAVAA